MKIVPARLPLFFLLFIALSSSAFSQITAADTKRLMAKEDTLAEYARYLVTDSLTEDRMIADSVFTRTLVRALQIKNSFYYPFDSLLGISKLYAPDSSFRLFTWNLQFDDYWSRQKGAIQLRTKDGSLKLIPLRDYSEFTTGAEDSARDPGRWIGAVYYNIIQTEYNGRNYYTLFGFDPYSVQSTKKWIDVLYFDSKNQPVFGGPFFSYQNDTPGQATRYRFSIEYKKDARTMVNYVDELGIILVDHLISETNQPELKWTYVPDGDSEGFKWEDGKWVHIDKVFNLKLQDGEAPVGEQLFDEKGNIDEKKLKEQAEKNKGKENGPPPF